MRVIICSVLATLAFASAAAAQIVVSSNDNKAVLVDGVNTVPQNPKPDTVSIINLNVSPPRLVAEFNVPGGWSAPPQSVAVAPDESIALVASSARVDPANPTRTVFNDELTVIDLKASPPVVLTTLRTGRRAAGVSINPAGTLALVANRAEGSISVFTIAGKTVTPAGKVDLGDAASEPSLPVFTPDGKTVLVTLNAGNRLAVLSVNGNVVEYTKRDIVANHKPYGLEISPRGDVAIVANIGNGPTGGVDTLTVLDLTAQPPRAVGGAFPGIVPEGIALSPDGRFLATCLQNGTQVPRSQPWFHDSGIVKVYRLDGLALTQVAEAKGGRWCQGLAWSRNADTLLAQCAGDNEINVFGFNGKQLTPRAPIKTSGSPTGIRTAQPPSRSARE